MCPSQEPIIQMTSLMHHSSTPRTGMCNPNQCSTLCLQECYKGKVTPSKVDSSPLLHDPSPLSNKKCESLWLPITTNQPLVVTTDNIMAKPHGCFIALNLWALTTTTDNKMACLDTSSTVNTMILFRGKRPSTQTCFI